MKRYFWVIILLIFFITPGLRADDISIYGTQSVSIPPNVLIIFDTSGSMDEALPGPTVTYDPGTTYSGSYTNAAVYRKEKVTSHHHSYWVYNLLISDYHNLNCPASKSDLENKGYTSHGVYMDYHSHTYECASHSHGTLYLGNWLNYDSGPQTSPTSKIDVAKSVITQLIDKTSNVHFGLMRFNTNNSGKQGGKLLAGCGDEDNDTLKNTINALQPNGYTPLAETLAEAGLYFAGKKSWYQDQDSNDYSTDCDKNGEGCKQYTSPITADLPCQKNYVIIMTDGEPTYDGDADDFLHTINKLADTPYINNLAIGDYDHDGNDPGDYSQSGSDYLDDVAKFLHDNDLRSDVGTEGSSFEKQNIVTYTIGFATDQPLLQETAENGGGKYYTANSISGLSAAFDEILSEIADVSGVFVSPVVPVSRMNGTYAGNSLYVGFFKPTEDGRWAGNIKKYGIDVHGDIVDAGDRPATETNGEIIENAQSYWSTLPDGPDVLSGGIGEVLQNQETRHLYTYIESPPSGASASENLIASINAFSTANSEILPDTLDVNDSTQKDNVINDIYGAGREWVMGDILHSKPAVVYYDTNNSDSLDEGDDAMIFAGGNDGIMHCFKDSDGSEVWGFIPPDLLSGLKDLSDPNVTTHEYFVDGSPKVYDEGIAGRKIIFFGERRGGSHYWALDVTDYNAPKYLYQIGSTFLSNTDGDGNGTLDGQEGGVASEDQTILGQSWSEPTVHEIRTSSTDTEKVFLMAGGYDANQDLPAYNPIDPDAPHRNATDSMGRAVFTINVLSGAINKLNVNAGYYSDMTHCIVDVSGFDTNGNGITNRVYAGDLGGNIFAFEDDGEGNWSRRKFFSASAYDSVQRKIFYAPDAVEETFGEMIFFGTGDRADPEGTDVVNRIYAIKNHWEADFSTPLDESDLYDATNDIIAVGNDNERSQAQTDLANKDGWFIKLENPGEKVTSPVVVFNRVVYFTTYTPESGEQSSGTCDVVSGQGTARLYAVNYLNGTAAFEWSNSTDTNHDKLDRSKIIGTSIASAPVIAILQGGPQIYIGVQGGVQKLDPNVTKNMETFFWRQLNN
jgi:type IV pilus assembly protein PilY1